MSAVTLADLGARLEKASDVFVFTHEVADGDALGSMVALVLYLRALGKQVYAFVPGRVQASYRFLGTDELLNTITEGEAWEVVHSRKVTCLSADAADIDRLAEWKNLFLAGTDRLVVDHHASNEGFGDAFYVDGTSSSCCEVLLALFTVLGHGPVDARVATALYAGLAADTGSFQYANTTAASLMHAAQLVELGASPEDISRNVNESRPYSTLKLTAASVMDSRLLYSGQVVLAHVTRRMLEEAGCDDEDTEGVTNELRKIAGTRVVIVLKESSDGTVKVSLRGKYGFDVKRIALAFGGGGHVLAAGCTIRGTIQRAEADVLAELDKYI
ncbi:MAG TPA: bifunctional oligoribonuclease/PAP phosphatase NrnA [Candidatus Cryosericum sp.]|nr:bifunctional oligoribonuclease/PAP phosphatase NrnA [Candidatus Cryosericum sp.]